MATSSTSAPAVPNSTINLNVLVAAIQQAVQAQNLIATNLKSVNATLTTTNTLVSTINSTFAAAFPAPIIGTQAWTPGGIASGASAAISFPLTGVTLGQFAKSSFSLDMQGCELVGYVQAANTVEVVIQNLTGSTVTFGAGSVKVSVASS